MNIVIFGGCGFIGRHLVDFLLMQEHLVSVVDLERSDKLHGSAVFIEAGFVDFEYWRSVFEEADVIIHLASVSDIGKNTIDPYLAIDRNLSVTKALFRYVDQLRGKLIYGSSLYAAGTVSGIYGATKQMNEILLGALEDLVSDLSVDIIRIGSVYGPGAPGANTISRLISQLGSQETLMLSSPHAKRSYIHVDDLIRLIDKMMLTPGKGQRVNARGQNPVSYSELISLIEEISGLTLNVQYSQVDFEGHYHTTPYRRQAIEKFTEVAGMETALDEGIKRLLVESLGE